MAIQSGHLDASKAKRTGQASASQSSLAPPDLAVAAARIALGRLASQRSTADSIPPIDYHIHSSLYFQGIDQWPSWHYVLSMLGYSGGPYMSFNLNNHSSGGMAALEIGASLVELRHDINSVLLTSSDRFSRPPFRPWSAEENLVFGDGGAAALLTSGAGFCRIVSSWTHTEPQLEGFARGNLEFYDFHDANCPDLGERSAQFFPDREGMAFFLRTIRGGISKACNSAVEEAQISLETIRFACLPFFGVNILQSDYLSVLGLDPAITTMSLGARLGHLGASDQLTGLDYALRTSRVKPGDHVLLLASGISFSWTAVVLRIEESLATAEDGNPWWGP
jgi:3-oxoacyl-[acyl-carrier-protein] synthase-3